MRKLKDEHGENPTIAHHFFRDEQTVAKGRHFRSKTTELQSLSHVLVPRHQL